LKTEIRRVALLDKIIDQGCLKFGSFRLKSGKISPHYLDLRQIISSPSLLAGVAEAYELLLRPLTFDRIAAIPVAAVPLAAAASLRLGKPFIYPRITAKDHGTGNAIEGCFRAGERVVLLDDVISSARSKLEAIAILEAAGLEVSDLVVLVDRESGGREEIEHRGIRFHAFAGISELLELARSRGLCADQKTEGVTA
jgi:uridine monophosphate synthetase